MYRSLVSLIFILFFSFLASNYSLAQSRQLQGRVIEKSNGKGLPSAHIIINGSKIGTVTDRNGFFKIQDLSAGPYQIQVRCLGYETKNFEIILSDDQPQELEILINESIITLKGTSIESFSIIGGKHKIDGLPGSASYITPKQLEKFNYNDITRLLRNIPGVNVQDEDGFGLRPNIGLRGTGVERSSKITLMEDGILIAPAPYVAPAAYYFPTTGRMQGIEVRKGSSQIKYGPYTTGGAINLLSTTIPDDLFGRVHLFGGSFGRMNLHAFAGDASENVAYLVETYQARSDGFKSLDNGNDTGYRTEDYLMKLRINTDENAKVYQSLSFKAGRYFEDANETYLGLTDEDFVVDPFHRYAASQNDNIRTDQSQLVLSHYIEPINSMKISTSFYRTDFSRNWYKLDKVKASDINGAMSISKVLEEPGLYNSEFQILKGSTSLNEDALFVKANNRSYYAKGIQTLFQNEFSGGNFDHLLDYGFRYHQDQIDRFQWVDEFQMDNGIMELTASGIQGTESNRIETATALAGFLQYTFKSKRVIFSPGLRFEDISIKRRDYGKSDPERTGSDLSKRENQVNVFIPGAGIDYIFNKSWNLFAGIHKGFSPPGSKDGTLPESSVNYEIGTRLKRNSLRVEAVGFFNNYNNLLGADLAASGGSGTGDLFNGGSAIVYGSELIIEYTPQFDSQFSLPVNVSYTFTHGEFQGSFESEFEGWGSVSEGDELPYVAPHQLVLNISLESPKFNVNVSSKYTSMMRTRAGSGEIDPGHSTDKSFILDLSGQYNISWQLGLFASVYNVTNAVYVVSRRPAGVRPGLPRSYTVGVKANF